MVETPRSTVNLAEEDAVIGLFAPAEADAIGLLAYALHRRSRLTFRADYAQRTGNPPSAEAEMAFLIAETTAGRLAAYRDEASRMISLGAAPAPAPTQPDPSPAKRWSFGMPAMTMPGEPVRVNWKGLIYRLAMLMLAVIATALLLRILFMRGA